MLADSLGDVQIARHPELRQTTSFRPQEPELLSNLAGGRAKSVKRGSAVGDAVGTVLPFLAKESRGQLDFEHD